MNKGWRFPLVLTISLMGARADATDMIMVNAPHSANGALAVAYGFDGVGGQFTRTAAFSGGTATIDMSGLTGPNIDVAVRAEFDAAGLNLSQHWWGNSLDEFTTLPNGLGFTDFSADVLTGEIIPGRSIDFVNNTATFRFQSSTAITVGELTDAFGDVFIPSSASPTLLASSRFNDYVNGQWSAMGQDFFGAVWNQSKGAWTSNGFTLTELARDGDYVRYEVDNGSFKAQYSAFDPTAAPDMLQVAMDVLSFGDQLFFGGATATLQSPGMIGITSALLDPISQVDLIPYYVQGAVFGEDPLGLGGSNLSQVFDSNVVWASPAAWVPEPGTAVTFLLGVLLLAGVRRCKSI